MQLKCYLPNVMSAAVATDSYALSPSQSSTFAFFDGDLCTLDIAPPDLF